MVRLLLAAGANALAKAKGGHSPLDIALNCVMEDVLELMLATVYGDFELRHVLGRAPQQRRGRGRGKASERKLCRTVHADDIASAS